MRKCPKCQVEKPLEDFYKKRGVEGKSSYCKLCANEQVTVRQKAFKKQCLNYKGNKCCVCNYNKCTHALEFHHVYPQSKSFGISNVKLTTFNQDIKNELDKCILVCANCHREIEAGVTPILDS